MNFKFCESFVEWLSIVLLNGLVLFYFVDWFSIVFGVNSRMDFKIEVSIFEKIVDYFDES